MPSHTLAKDQGLERIDLAFARMARTDVSCIVHERAIAADFADWLDGLPPSRLPDGRALLRPDQCEEALTAIFSANRTPSGPMRDRLTRDIAQLVERFSAFSGSALVDLRLEAMTHDHCWRFHRDNVPWRLLTTYRGAGTEWVDTEDAERALDEQRSYCGPINRLPRFAIGMFKGLASGPELAVLHRSPPMPSRQMPAALHARLLLCLNLPSETSAKPWP